MTGKCEWCADPDGDAYEPNDPEALCDMHNAEYCGFTEAQLDAQRMAELWDQL